MHALDEAILADAAALESGDPHGVLLALAGAGAQVRRAAELVALSPVPSWAPDERPRSVVVAARGGSAVVAEAVVALLGAAAPVPVVACAGSTLPAWAGALDLVVAVSLSGRADQAVALAVEAGRRGARLLTVGAAGSPLQLACERARGVHVPLPEPGWDVTAAPTSRTALWSMLVPPLLACEQLGLMDAVAGSLDDVAAALDAEAEACRPSAEPFTNPAKLLALELAGTVPVILGDDRVGAVAAHRAASVLARTARMPAVHGSLPDDAGDVVATFAGELASGGGGDLVADHLLGDVPSTRLRLVLLQGGERRAAQAVLALAEEAGVGVSLVRVDGTSPLSVLAQLVARTDFAATYLALSHGLDPALSPQLADLRAALS